MKGSYKREEGVAEMPPEFPGTETGLMIHTVLVTGYSSACASSQALSPSE